MSITQQNIDIQQVEYYQSGYYITMVGRILHSAKDSERPSLGCTVGFVTSNKQRPSKKSQYSDHSKIQIKFSMKYIHTFTREVYLIKWINKIILFFLLGKLSNCTGWMHFRICSLRFLHWTNHTGVPELVTQHYQARVNITLTTAIQHNLRIVCTSSSLSSSSSSKFGL